MDTKYIHYGCGLKAPKEWLNFDSSPTLRIQKIPLVGALVVNKLNTKFPSNVRYGDIVKGLPIKEDSCEGIYCSHVLEHLSLYDFYLAIQNTYKILKPGGVFRCVVPDLEEAARSYLGDIARGDSLASVHFIGKKTSLGLKTRSKGLKGILTALYQNSGHRWMWDRYSLSEELKKVGFRDLRFCNFNDSEDRMFALVEDEVRFVNAVAIECNK